MYSGNISWKFSLNLLELPMAHPLPKLPFHVIDGLVNFRDLGGFRIAAGSDEFVRPNLIFRSAAPSQLTPEAVSRLQALGIRHVYDLRSRAEIDRVTRMGEAGKVTELDGAQRVFVPVFLDQDYTPEAIALWYKRFSSEGPEVSCDPGARLRHQDLTAKTSALGEPFQTGPGAGFVP